MKIIKLKLGQNLPGVFMVRLQGGEKFFFSNTEQGTAHSNDNGNGDDSIDFKWEALNKQGRMC